MTSDINILTNVISFITKNVLSEMISSRYYIESVRSHDGNCTLLSMFPSHVSDFKLQLSGYSFISSLHCSRVSSAVPFYHGLALRSSDIVNTACLISPCAELLWRCPFWSLSKLVPSANLSSPYTQSKHTLQAYVFLTIKDDFIIGFYPCYDLSTRLL